MNFVLLRSSAFIRNTRKIVKKQPELASNLQEILELLSSDPFYPQLRTHKFKGDLKDSYACSAGYDRSLSKAIAVFVCCITLKA